MNLLNTIKGLYEKVDPQDTGGAEEASMIKGQIKQIKHYIEGIEKAVDKDGDVEEWVQNKLTKATDYLKSVYGYKLGQDDSGEMDEEVDLEEAKSPINITRKDLDKLQKLDLERGKIFFKSLIKQAADSKSQKRPMRSDKAEYLMRQVDAKRTADQLLQMAWNMTLAGDDKGKSKYGRLSVIAPKFPGQAYNKRFGLSNEEFNLTEELEMAIEEGKRFGLTQSLLDAVKNVLAAETKPEEDKLDPVDPKALKGKHADRKDKDIDNDGDVDDSDKYLHKRRQAVSKAMKENDEEMEDDDDKNKDDVKKSMAKNTDDDDEKSAEEKQKEKEYIAKKSDRKEPVDVKPTVKESLARRTLSRMMKDKENVKNVRIPTPAERRAEMSKKERHIFTDRDAAVKKQHELGGKAKIVTGTGKSAGKFLVVTEDLDLYEVTAYRVVNKKGTTIKSFGTDGSAASKLAQTSPDYKVVTDNVPFTPDKPRKNPPATAGKKGLGHSIAKHLAKKGMASVKEEEQKEEMTPEQEKKREEIVMALKKKMPEFEAKYGDRAKEVMYATATKMAMKD